MRLRKDASTRKSVPEDLKFVAPPPRPCRYPDVCAYDDFAATAEDAQRRQDAWLAAGGDELALEAMQASENLDAPFCGRCL